MSKSRKQGLRWRPRGREWVWALGAAGLVANGLRLRARLQGLTVLDTRGPVSAGEAGSSGVQVSATGAPTPPRAGDTAASPRAVAVLERSGGAPAAGVAGPGQCPVPDRFLLVVVDGCRVDPETVEAAARHADAHGLDLLELVPADLDAERALDVARVVDGGTYRQDRLAAGRGAAQALLVDQGLLARLDARTPDRALTEADLAELVAQAKLHAPVSCDLVVTDGVHAAAETPDRRRALLHVVYGGVTPVALVVPFVGFATLVAGIVLAPVWALLAAAAYCAQPVVALRGGPLARGLSAGRLAGRPLTGLRRAVTAAASAARPHATLVGERPVGEEAAREQAETARARYAAMLAGGTDRFFEPRRTTCPWCGGGDLALHVTCTDDLQNKPGTFHLDRCRGCGHTFQNPALSPAGLDFYYGDFYDGVGEDELEAVFASSAAPYEGRAGLVRRHLDGPDPRTWLDVGTGHGHFCLVARAEFPHTRFEGLDLGAAVQTAARRGWIDEAHQGLFPDVAPDLAGRFDVVSMHHYLEHTRDPAAEVAAVRQVLRPGGHLLIELPDPECWAGSVLGRWWGPWFQPQHQHLMPLGNLCDRLRDSGFTVVATERGEAHQPVTATMGLWLFLNHIAPKVGQPWQSPATVAGTARRLAVFTAGAPVIVAALVLDQLAGRVVRRLPRGSNTYRILARSNGDPSGGPAAASVGAAPPRGAQNGETSGEPIPSASAAGTPRPSAPVAGTPRPSAPVTGNARPPTSVTATPRPPASEAARHARRQRRAQAYEAVGLSPVPPPEPEGWAPVLLDLLAPRAGGPIAYGQAPAALDHAHGPWAFGTELVATGGGTLDPAWQGPLAVRLGDRAGLEREASALAAATAAGVRVPAVLAGVELPAGVELGAPDCGGGEGLHALVTTRPADPPVPEVIRHRLNDSEQLIGGFADNHAALHDRTAAAPPAGVPVIDAAAEVERFDITRHAPTVAWLRAHAPSPDPERAVLCHGGYQLLCVHAPGPDGWAHHGGPGRGLTTTNWCGAVVAEREYDVAFTLLSFWSAPYFAPTRAERTAVKMIRNTLANSYRQAYARRQGLDGQRLAFWQVFHALRGIARLDGTYDAAGSPYAATDRGPLPAALRDQLVRYTEMVIRG